MIAAPLIIAAIFISYFFFSAPIPDRPPATTGLSPQEAASQNAAAELELARLRTEARRNTLAAGGGFVAIAALILALRRQHHHEKSTSFAEDDALQRRITDARIRAVEQLGSDNPAVRIGGIHNLERIGQQHTELRQVVLDEICSYLRLPYTPPAPETKKPISAALFEPTGPPPAETHSDQAEREVRLIAQEVLQRHLTLYNQDLYWQHSRLNLRNAHLDAIQLAGAHLSWADFTNATFTDTAQFMRVTFTGDARFVSVTFTGNAHFDRATFTGNAHFGGATFSRTTRFTGMTFTGNALFIGATFAEDALFRTAIFTRAAKFESASFGGYADFKGTTFGGPIEFGGVRVQGALCATSPASLEVLRRQGVCLRIEAHHQLPKEWDLNPDPTNPGWGHLTNQTATTPG